MKSRSQCRLSVVGLPFLLVTYLAGQGRSQEPPKSGVELRGFTWTETYEGSGNSDGFISDVNSTVGYTFGQHFAMAAGVPYLFIEPSTSKTGTTSTSGMGNPYVGLRYSAKGPTLDFSTRLTGAMPVASTAKGLSTGHVTVDWSNHFAHGFDPFTPFVDLGFGNSISDTRFLHRPSISYGNLAHFDGGSEFDLGSKSSITASGYYILPWGPQQVFGRGKKSSSGPTKGGTKSDPGRRSKPRIRLQSHPFSGFECWLQLQCVQRTEHVFLRDRVEPGLVARETRRPIA